MLTSDKLIVVYYTSIRQDRFAFNIILAKRLSIQKQLKRSIKQQIWPSGCQYTMWYGVKGKTQDVAWWVPGIRLGFWDKGWTARGEENSADSVWVSGLAFSAWDLSKAANERLAGFSSV